MAHRGNQHDRSDRKKNKAGSVPDNKKVHEGAEDNSPTHSICSQISGRFAGLRRELISGGGRHCYLCLRDETKADFYPPNRQMRCTGCISYLKAEHPLENPKTIQANLEKDEDAREDHISNVKAYEDKNKRLKAGGAKRHRTFAMSGLSLCLQLQFT